MIVAWQQATTGKLHRREMCGISSRPRYYHFRREMTPAEVAAGDRCAKCWPTVAAADPQGSEGGSRPAPSGLRPGTH